MEGIDNLTGKQHKKFILHGNVVDLSTGVIIGAAFTKGVVEPILALAGGGPQPRLTIPIMTKLVEIKEKNAAGEEVTRRVNKLIELDLGLIIGALVSFLITTAVAFFVIVKPVNKLIEMANRPKEEPAAPPVSEDIKLLTEIRDRLKARDGA